MSTGNLRLIRGNKIRAGISAYYTEIEARGQWIQNWREYQIKLGHLVPHFVPLEFRYAYEFQGDMPDIGEGNADGLPWVLQETIASDVDAQNILDSLVALAEAKPAIENMVRTQGVHYTYHSIVRDRVRELIEALEKYNQELSN